MKTLVFVGAHDLMVPYINNLACTHQVCVYDSGVFTVQLSPEVVVRKLPKKFFGIQMFLTGERSLPWYMSHIQSSLKNDNPDDIIVLDFIRLWYLQVLWYRLKNRSVRIHLYSESQRIPPSLFSAASFILFWLVLFCTQKLLTAYFAFTDRGIKFAQKIGIRVPIILLPAPIDTQLFYPNETKEFLKDGILRIIINARYVKYKRHQDLLKALVIVKASGVPFILTCIGRGGDRSVIEREVEALGLSKEVFFLEPVPRDKLVFVYQKHDVLVLPSDNEAIGMVAPEAMACGLVTITSDTVGANVYVVPNETGVIIKTGDIQSLANSLMCLTPVSCKRMSIAARMRIMEFSTEEFTKKMYNTIVTNI